MSKSALYFHGDDGNRHLSLPAYKYQNLQPEQLRFLTLLPCSADKNDAANHVKCTFTQSTLAEAAGTFVAVKNGRGYKRLQEAIEIEGEILLISVALENFLRHFRRNNEPVKLWVRYICLDQSNNNEIKKYWTRPFVEAVYESANEVVDMSTFNTELLDSHQILPVHDIQYGEWTKDWNGVPEGFQSTLPNVFPMRLGQQPDMDNPKDIYKYVPLDVVTKEIRVLVLVNSEDPAALVVAHLAHCPIRCEVPYHALSYTWGDSQQTAELVVNGQRITVRKNLEVALRALRRPTKPVVIWADAICIDQSNPVERNRQLLRMADIYDGSFAVISYLGAVEDGDDAELAYDFIPHLQDLIMRFDDEGHWIIGTKEERIGVDRYPRLCGALYRLLTRPYFRRVWILQEVANASNLTLGCGNRFDYLFDKLDIAASNLQDMLRRDPELTEQIVTATPGLDKISDFELTYVRKLFYFRHLLSKGADAGPLSTMGGWLKMKNNSPGFLEAATLARDFEATDGHDKIFALWDLAQDKEDMDFTMSYAESIPRTFVDFTKAWIHQHASLDIIAAAEPFNDSNEFYKTVPTWTSDWTTRSSTSSLLRRESIPKKRMRFMRDLSGTLYSTDGAVKNGDFDKPLFELDDSTIHATGVVIDRLAGFFTLDNTSQITGKELTVYERFYTIVHAFCEHYKTSEVCPYADPRQAAVAMLHGDVPSAWSPRNKDTKHDEDEQMGYVCDPTKSRHVEPYAGSYSGIDAWDTVDAVLRGRALGITQKGYMFLLPQQPPQDSEDESGDGPPWLLAIVATCSTPVLLRQYEDGFHRLGGSVFVQGWMEGEVFADAMGAASPKEFWASKLDDEKLMIR